MELLFCLMVVCVVEAFFAATASLYAVWYVFVGAVVLLGLVTCMLTGENRKASSILGASFAYILMIFVIPLGGAHFLSGTPDIKDIPKQVIITTLPNSRQSVEVDFGYQESGVNEAKITSPVLSSPSTFSYVSDSIVPNTSAQKITFKLLGFVDDKKFKDPTLDKFSSLFHDQRKLIIEVSQDNQKNTIEMYSLEYIGLNNIMSSIRDNSSAEHHTEDTKDTTLDSFHKDIENAKKVD